MSYGELSNTQETMVLPMLQMKNIRGKPYITVSAKGMINGLSNIPNDGADFGPDTTKGATAPGQYGSPYTETSGIQEGLNYLGNNNGGELAVGDGLFYTSTQINIPNTVAIRVHGTLPSQNSESTASQGGTVIISTSTMTSVISLVLGSSLAPAGDIFENFSIFTYSDVTYGVYFNNPNYPTIGFEGIIVRNVEVLNASTTLAPTAGFYFGGLDIRLYNLTHGTLSGSLSATYGIQLDAEYEIIRLYDYKEYDPASSAYFAVDGMDIINGVINGITSSATTLTIIGGELMDNTSTGSLFSLISSPSQTISIYGTWILFLNDQTNLISTTMPTNSVLYLSMHGCFFNIQHTPSITLINTTNKLSYTSIVMETNTIVNYQTASVNISPFGSIPSNSAVNWNFKQLNTFYFGNSNVTLIDNTQPAITPTVPASGTAQENTNPYAVDVYVYGGAVTEIQITKGGTAYTVFSVSTAIAMSGQAYKLNPGDSITVTYSTAPSWEWLSD